MCIFIASGEMLGVRNCESAAAAPAMAASDRVAAAGSGDPGAGTGAAAGVVMPKPASMRVSKVVVDLIILRLLDYNGVYGKWIKGLLKQRGPTIV